MINVTEEERKQVFDIDDAILVHEFLNIMGEIITDQIPELYSVSQFVFTGFDVSKRQFLRMFHQLTTGKKECFSAGIDWMNPYWLAAKILENEISIRKLTNIAEINNYYRNADAVLIDIPVGLPENAAENATHPDREARDYMPVGRKSSIFPVPCRQAVNIAEYAKASAENECILGKKLTSQSHAFSRMISQVDEFLAEDKYWQNRLVESHPEIAFQRLNDGNGLRYSKHTEAGIQERIVILQQYGINPLPLFAEFAPKQYENVLDALCLAVSAKLGCENGFLTIPENRICDSQGLKMQMVFGMIIWGVQDG